MSRELSVQPPAETQRKSWASRVFQGFGARAPAPSTANGTAPQRTQRGPAEGSTRKVQGMTHRLIADERYAFVLLKETVEDIAERDTLPAWRALADHMAMVPTGIVPVVRSDGTSEPTEVHGFYLDRCPVTNQQYQRFVDAGGYDNLEIWPQEVWPSVMRFTDHSGAPGPKGWDRGRYPSGKAEHPVVGVCWYEALAYSRWAGKRLPTAAEWQKAGGWPEHLSGGGCNRYPWGDIFDPARANLWSTGVGTTVPVRDFAKGATPNGIYQLSGNVWEWLEDTLESIPCRSDESFQVWKPLRRIAGGAFNTYFPAEATCQFVTGQPELDRNDNIGFRCALSADRLRPAP